MGASRQGNSSSRTTGHQGEIPITSSHMVSSSRGGSNRNIEATGYFWDYSGTTNLSLENTSINWSSAETLISLLSKIWKTRWCISLNNSNKMVHSNSKENLNKISSKDCWYLSTISMAWWEGLSTSNICTLTVRTATLTTRSFLAKRSPWSTLLRES